MKSKILKNYQPLYSSPLVVTKGDRVTLDLSKKNPPKWEGWIWAIDARGNSGWISKNFIQEVKETNIITRNYNAKELDVTEGESVDVRFFEYGWAWCKKQDGEEGWIPDEILRPLFSGIPIHLSQYIKHYSEIQDENRNSDFGRKLGFTNLGIHHLTLAPGEKSSDPHCESDEEEMVYIVEGEPHVWINGYLYEASPGDCITFPSGTGVCHAIFNNTRDNVRILNIGERTKDSNRCYFVDQKINEDCKIRWNNWPQQEIGPHSGRVGEISCVKSKSERPVYFNHYSELFKNETFSYPGDKETFQCGSDLARGLGFKNIAVWHDIVNAGSRSSWPHAHSQEDEFVFVLKGHPSVWIDGYICPLGPGMSVSFPAGTGHAHCLINNSNDEAHVIVVGEQESKEDKIFYPFHEKRNRECMENETFWKSHPKHELGDHNGRPDMLNERCAKRLEQN